MHRPYPSEKSQFVFSTYAGFSLRVTASFRAHFTPSMNVDCSPARSGISLSSSTSFCFPSKQLLSQRCASARDADSRCLGSFFSTAPTQLTNADEGLVG